MVCAQRRDPVRAPLVSDRKADFDNITELTGSGRMNFGIGLSCDERQRHQGHYRQADYFVEVSYE